MSILCNHSLSFIAIHTFRFLVTIADYQTVSTLKDAQHDGRIFGIAVGVLIVATVLATIRTSPMDIDMDFDELVKWYDGYKIGDEQSMFNPNSVIQAIDARACESFWATTGAFERATDYIQMNFEGLKDAILAMLAGERVNVNTTKFQNDMSIVKSRDDVLTVLIHLAYLSYDRQHKDCGIPNFEVAGEMQNAVEDTNWTNIVEALQQSEQLLQATLKGNAEAVAQGIDATHDEETSTPTALHIRHERYNR